MNARLGDEGNQIIQEWKQRAIDDFQSAELLLKGTDYFEIVTYHAHQAIEKILKAKLLERGDTFKFIHDLTVLYKQVFDKSDSLELFERISFVQSLYPTLRYPTGDEVTKEQAEKALQVAKEIFKQVGGM